jgi:hypothetical protein
MQLTIGRKTHQISSNSQTLIETVKMSWKYREIFLPYLCQYVCM